MTDQELIRIGREILRKAAADTEPGRLAASIGAMLYDGIGHSCWSCKCESSEHHRKRYETQVKRLTEVQGYLEGVAAIEAERKVQP